MDPLYYWRSCEELTIVQAALLVLGLNPNEFEEHIESNYPTTRPEGYNAMRTALVTAIERKRLQTQRTIQLQTAEELDVHRTKISVEDLRTWLIARKIKSDFFFPSPERGPDYLSKSHPHYAPKLAAAVSAWMAISADAGLRRGKSVKKALIEWLRQNANEFELTKKDGKPNKQGIDDVAKIANWHIRGGAPKTPGKG